MNTKKEIAKLGKMKVNELQAKFAEVIGEKTRCPNKTFLLRRITEALQAKAPTDTTALRSGVSTKPHGKTSDPVVEKLTRLDVDELRARYIEAIGRPTGSTNKAYMIWKIREAKKGRVSVGPRNDARRAGVTFKILPLRMETVVVNKVDDAWRSRGIKNRMAFFRGALGHYLKHLGAEDAAALFSDAAVVGT